MRHINNLELIKNSISTNSITLIDEFINKKKTLCTIEELHLYIIKKVLSIHVNEVSHTNITLASNSVNIGHIIDKVSHGNAGCGIYFFNESIPYYIIGDIHSDSKSILRMLNKIDFINKILNNEKINLIFLGDYVDRGDCHIKTMELILIIKYLFPKNIYLLRGNHDGGELLADLSYKLSVDRNANVTDDYYFVSYVYNILKENNKGLSLLKGYLQFFNSLCTHCFIKSGHELILGVHGGIPRPREHKFDYIVNLGNLTDNSIVDYIGENVIQNALWSDPSDELINSLSEKRRFRFDINHFNVFSQKIGITKLIRGHQAFTEGCKEFFDGKLISIFSSGNLYNNSEFNNNINDETAYKGTTPSILLFENGIKKIIVL